MLQRSTTKHSGNITISESTDKMNTLQGNEKITYLINSIFINLQAADQNY